jgi:hypothetical protein
MEASLYTRLKDEYRDILDTQKIEYPTMGGIIEDALKSKEFYVNLTLGEASDLKLILKLHSMDDIYRIFK